MATKTSAYLTVSNNPAVWGNCTTKEAKKMAEKAVEVLKRSISNLLPDVTIERCCATEATTIRVSPPDAGIEDAIDTLLYLACNEASI